MPSEMIRSATRYGTTRKSQTHNFNLRGLTPSVNCCAKENERSDAWGKLESSSEQKKKEKSKEAIPGQGEFSCKQSTTRRASLHVCQKGVRARVSWKPLEPDDGKDV